MYKHIALLVRDTSMSHEEFVDYWETEHVPLLREIEGVVRCHTVLPENPDHAEFDGIAELYFDSLEALHDAMGGEGGREPDPTNEAAAAAREDARNFLDIESCRRFIGEEVLRKDTIGDTDGLYKHSAFLVRKEGMSHDEFRDYWENQHTPLAKDIEGVVRYHTVYPVDPTNSEYDGVAELYFETIEDLHDALGSPGSRDYDPTREVAAKAREDVDNFLAVKKRPRLIGREKVRLDATEGVEGY